MLRFNDFCLYRAKAVEQMPVSISSGQNMRFGAQIRGARSNLWGFRYKKRRGGGGEDDRRILAGLVPDTWKVL